MSTNHNLLRERRAEAVSNLGPSAFQPTAIPLGQTGSHSYYTSLKTCIAQCGEIATCDCSLYVRLFRMFHTLADTPMSFIDGCNGCAGWKGEEDGEE